MEILIPDIWLRDFLKTKAKPKQIAKYLSLSGPSVNKVEKIGKQTVYSIEVTTNRVDAISVYGIAREAAAILPRFGIKTKLIAPKTKAKPKFVKKVDYLKAEVDQSLCSRFTAVLIKEIKIKESPQDIKERLQAVGVRPINNVVDISNYIMHELGQPVHTFDYDKIKGSKMLLRASKKGEILTTLDAKKQILPGGDIVIEDASGQLIDLAGIMGAKNSQVDKNTNNVLLFVQTYNPVNIRKTSMTLAQRTEAATLFEKGLDPELVTLAIRRGIDLFEKLLAGKAEPKVLDLYPHPYKAKSIKTTEIFLNKKLGIQISKLSISQILRSLGFEPRWNGNTLTIQIPSFRANDINLPENIVEEIARLYGYHKLPSKLMAGVIPDPLTNAPFGFETKVKNLLVGWGATEIYTSSMVPKKFVDKKALKLKNPLGLESQYLRTRLMPSLVEAANQNSGEKDPFHLFEMANVYLKRKGQLPEEKLCLAGLFANFQYREGKGIIEVLLKRLNIKACFEAQDTANFLPSHRLTIKSGKEVLGQFGILENDYIYYDFDLERLRNTSSAITSYKPLPKYPSQIEDITFKLPLRTKIGDVIVSMESVALISQVELKDIYKDAYTFRVCYQHPAKTLTNEEVKRIRNKLLNKVKKKFGGIVKN